MNVALFYGWEDWGVCAPWSHPSDMHLNYTGPVPNFFLSPESPQMPYVEADAMAEGLMLQRPWFTDKADDNLRSHPASSLRGLF